jgi:hypothetical protein
MDRELGGSMTKTPVNGTPKTVGTKTAALIKPGVANPPRKRKSWLEKFPFLSLFYDDATTEDFLEDHIDFLARYQRLARLITAQSVAIGILTALMIFGAPVLRPVNKYSAITPGRAKQELVSLFTPNLTSQAILSWAATSVTEVMTIGFGDFDERVRFQRKRFTNRGWQSFQKAIMDQKLREAFKSRQLILTTVPSNTPVIVAQGADIENGYIWIVEMPIILTFVTNNNVSKKSRAIARLAIVRVPSTENVRGIAINSWNLV